MPRKYIIEASSSNQTIEIQRQLQKILSKNYVINGRKRFKICRYHIPGNYIGSVISIL